MTRKKRSKPSYITAASSLILLFMLSCGSQKQIIEVIEVTRVATRDSQLSRPTPVNDINVVFRVEASPGTEVLINSDIWNGTWAATSQWPSKEIRFTYRLSDLIREGEERNDILAIAVGTEMVEGQSPPKITCEILVDGELKDRAEAVRLNATGYEHMLVAACSYNVLE